MQEPESTEIARVGRALAPRADILYEWPEPKANTLF
jgi:hypothetical protein